MQKLYDAIDAMTPGEAAAWLVVIMLVIAAVLMAVDMVRSRK